MPDPQDTQNPQIEGLPPGAVLKPLAQSNPSQIEGLPAGAVLRPINGSQQPPDEVAARHARSVSDARARGLQTNLPDQEDFMDKVRTGIGKRGLEIGQGVVGLVNKGMAAAQNMDLSGKVTPETLQLPVPGTELETETHGVGETLGGIGADVAALEAGGHVIKGFSTLLKLPEAALALAEKYPSISKHILSLASKATGTGAEIVEGAVKSGKPALETAAKLAELKPGIAGAVGTVGKTAAMTGTQGAVEESAPGGQGPVAGFEQGAEGGALGASFAEVTGPALGKLAKAVGLGTDDTADIMRAVQTGKRNTKFLDDWKTAAPRILDDFKLSGEPKDLEEAADRIGDIRRNIWDNEITPAIQKHGKEVFDASKVAGSVRKILTDHPELARNFPEDAKFIQEFADKYTSGTPLFSGDRTVSEAEKEIELYNAKLTNEGYWKKSPKERAALEKADPKIAAWRTASDSLRDGLYQHLDNAGEPGMAALKNEYGAVGNVENEVRGQVNVAARQRPISLKQTVGMAAGIAHGGPSGIIAAAIPILDKLYNEPVALFNRAVAKSAPAGPVKQAAKKVLAAVGGVAKDTAPVVGGNLIRFIASDGSKHSVDASEWEKVKQMDSGAKKQD